MRFTLDDNHRAELEKLANSGMTPVLIAQRAKILLMKADGMSATAVAEEVGVSRHTAELWIKKYRNRLEDTSLEELLNVDKGRGRKEEITGEAKTWLISQACTQPKELGYAAELWTTKSLTRHINETAADAGFGIRTFIRHLSRRCFPSVSSGVLTLLYSLVSFLKFSTR
jgi:transposase